MDPLFEDFSTQWPRPSHTTSFDSQCAPGALQSIWGKLGNCGICPLLFGLLSHCAAATAIKPNNVNNRSLFIFFCRHFLSTLFYPRLNDSNCWTRMNVASVFILFFQTGERALNFVIVAISTKDFLGVVAKVSQQQGFVGGNYWGWSCTGIQCLDWRVSEIIWLIWD